jgi:hypothetical protein
VKKEKSQDFRKGLANIRKVQAIFLGIFTLGLSMTAGDYGTFVKSPVSTLSITTTLFGFMGSLVCEFMARKAEKW